jgi:hypothetical protein
MECCYIAGELLDYATVISNSACTVGGSCEIAFTTAVLAVRALATPYGLVQQQAASVRLWTPSGSVRWCLWG